MEILWSIFADIWLTGLIWGEWAALTIFLVLFIIEFGWLVLRWLTDAKETWSDLHAVRSVWCGDLDTFIPNKWPGENIDETEVGGYLLAVLLYCAAFAVLTLFWPFLVITAATYGVMLLLRGGFRLRRLVWAAVKELKNKADKSHNHNGVYVPK